VRVRRVRRLAADEARKLQLSIKTHSSIAFKRIASHATREIDLLHTRMLLAASETRVQHKQSFYSRSGIVRRHCRAQAEKVFNFHADSMTKHMSEMVSINGVAHVHQNACYVVHLEHNSASAAEFHTVMKGEEGKEVALVTTEGLLNVDKSDSRAIRSPLSFPKICKVHKHHKLLQDKSNREDKNCLASGDENHIQ
jgi:hypothetical protein